MNRIISTTMATLCLSFGYFAHAQAPAQNGVGTTGANNAMGTGTDMGMGTAGSDMVGMTPVRYDSLGAWDKHFVTEASQRNQGEVQDGTMAASRGQSDAVRQFGNNMVRDHTNVGSQMNRLVAADPETLPTTADAKHLKISNRLAQQSGMNFDRQYVHQQVKDHQDTIRLFERESGSGGSASLRQFASAQLPTLRQHLQMAKDLESSLNGSGMSSADSSMTNMGTAGTNTTTPAPTGNTTGAGDTGTGTGAPGNGTGNTGTGAPGNGTGSTGAGNPAPANGGTGVGAGAPSPASNGTGATTP